MNEKKILIFEDEWNTRNKSLSSLLFCTSGNVESATKGITLKGLITSQ